MALNRSDKSRILRRYFPGMTRNSEMSTEPNLVPFPLEYALYRIPVSPARHSRLRGNPELEVTFQYRQDHLETVLVEQHPCYDG